MKNKIITILFGIFFISLVSAVSLGIASYEKLSLSIAEKEVLNQYELPQINNISLFDIKKNCDGSICWWDSSFGYQLQTAQGKKTALELQNEFLEIESQKAKELVPYLMKYPTPKVLRGEVEIKPTEIISIK